MRCARFSIGVLFVALGCGDDGATDGAATESSSSTTDATEASTATTPATGSPTSVDTTATSSGTTATTTPATDGTTASDTGSSSTGENECAFIFDARTDPPEAYTLEDNAGFPAFNTAMNIVGDGSQHDVHNQSLPPVVDPNGLSDSLRILHCGGGLNVDCDMMVDGLRNDIMGLGLTPCIPPQLGFMQFGCFEQMRPLVDPDQLTLNLDQGSRFPNGRAPGEYVMDEILAYLLLSLDLGPKTGVHDPDRFEDLGPILGNEYTGLGFNPSANDVPIPATFPYLAPAQ